MCVFFAIYIIIKYLRVNERRRKLKAGERDGVGGTCRFPVPRNKIKNKWMKKSKWARFFLSENFFSVIMKNNLLFNEVTRGTDWKMKRGHKLRFKYSKFD